LKLGATSVSSGPLVVVDLANRDDGHEGALVRLPQSKHLSVRVRVYAPAWVPVDRVKLCQDDTPTSVVPVVAKGDGLRLDHTFDVAATKDVVVYAVAEAAAPLPDVLPDPKSRAFGFTGPIYLDADGDGSCIPGPARPETVTPAATSTVNPR